MIYVPEEIKFLLKSDSVRKNMRISFPDGEHSDIINDNLVQDSAKFTESICSRDELKFGLCEKAQFEVDINNIENIKGARIDVEIEIDVEDIKKYSNDVYFVTNKIVEKSEDKSWIEQTFNDDENISMSTYFYHDALLMDYDFYDNYKYLYYEPLNRLYTMASDKTVPYDAYVRTYDLRFNIFIYDNQNWLEDLPIFSSFSSYARRIYFRDYDASYDSIIYDDAEWTDGTEVTKYSKGTKIPYDSVVAEIDGLYGMKIRSGNKPLTNSSNNDLVSLYNDKGQVIDAVYAILVPDYSVPEDDTYTGYAGLLRIVHIHKSIPYYFKSDSWCIYNYEDAYMYTVYTLRLKELNSTYGHTNAEIAASNIVSNYINNTEPKVSYPKILTYITPDTDYINYNDIIYSYPEGSIRSSDISYKYYPIPYGEFVIDECNLDDTKKQRHIVAYTSPLVAEKLCKSEKDKMEWATRIKKNYVPNVIGFVCSQSYIDPEDYGDFIKTAIFDTSYSGSQYYKPSSATAMHVAGYNKQLLAFRNSGQTNIYKGMEIYKKMSSDGGYYLHRPWIAHFNNTDVYLDYVYATILVKGYSFELTDFNKYIIYRIKHDSNYLSSQLYEILDNESSDYGVTGNILTIGGTIASLCENFDSTYYEDDNVIRKVVFCRLLKEYLSKKFTSISREGIYPFVQSTYRVGNNGKEMNSYYSAEYGSIYLFGNDSTNSNTKSSEIIFPRTLTVQISSVRALYVTRDTSGNVISETFKKFSNKSTYGQYGNTVISLVMPSSGMELSKFSVYNYINYRNCTVTFPLISNGEDKDTEKFDPDEDVNVEDYANAMLETFGRFAYWNRKMNMYGTKRIGYHNASTNTISIDNLNLTPPSNNIYPTNYDSSDTLYPTGPEHHIRKEECESLTFDDEEKFPITSVRYKNHVDSKDEEGNDIVDEFEEVCGQDASDEVLEYNKSVIYDVTDNILFNKLKKTYTDSSQTTVKEDPAKDLAEQILSYIKGIGYKPANIEMMGRPYLEAGDLVSFEGVMQHDRPTRDLRPKYRSGSSSTSGTGTIEEDSEEEEPVIEAVGYTTIALRRTLSGIQHLRDSIESK